MSIGVMLFNPFTGTPRLPEDIKSDPEGMLVWDGEATLRAAKRVLPDCRTCANYDSSYGSCLKRFCLDANKYVASQPKHIWHIHPKENSNVP